MNLLRLAYLLVLLALGTVQIFLGMYLGPSYVERQTVHSVQEVRAKIDDLELVQRLWGNSETVKDLWAVVSICGFTTICVAFVWYVSDLGKAWNTIRLRGTEHSKSTKITVQDATNDKMEK
jgi:hypothetical protein